MPHDPSHLTTTIAAPEKSLDQEQSRLSIRVAFLHIQTRLLEQRVRRGELCPEEEEILAVVQHGKRMVDQMAAKAATGIAALFAKT